MLRCRGSVSLRPMLFISKFYDSLFQSILPILLTLSLDGSIIVAIIDALPIFV